MSMLSSSSFPAWHRRVAATADRRRPVILRAVVVLAASCLVHVDARASEQSPEYLADAKADQITATCGELGLNAPCNDRTATLQIKDKRYRRGLSQKAGDDSSLFVPLDGRYETFESEIGVQWQGGGSRASVEFLVYVDDKMVFESGIVCEGDPPRKIRIPISGAEMLQLVATAGGDGDADDVADWAEARLIPDTRPTPRRSGAGVDIAAFARVVTSDPKRMTGTAATRVDEFPAEDISLETDLQPRSDRSYAVPLTADGIGCIGLRWHEIRFPRRLELHWSAEAAIPTAETVELQYWAGLPYASPWQGQWKPLPAEVERSGRVWSWQIAPKDLPLGTVRVRWVISECKDPPIVNSLAAFSRSSWTTAELRVELKSPPVDLRVANGPDSVAKGPVDGEGHRPRKQAQVVVYNGDLLESAQENIVRHLAWDIDEPLVLKARYSEPRARKDDRTLLRFELPGATISVAVEDVVTHGCVYVPSVGLFVTGNPPRTTLSQYLEQIAGKKTVLEQVREHPDQTFAQAMAKTHNPIQNRGPMLISLACDNRKFVVQRDGEVVFDLYDAPDGDYDTARFWELIDPNRTYFRMIPQFGSGEGDIQRHLNGDWLPKPVTTVTEDGVKYRQCSYVAPVDQQAPEGCPIWYRQRAICVSEYTVENTRSTEADVALTLTLLKDGRTITRDAFEQVENGLIAVDNGRVLGFFDTHELSSLHLADQVDGVAVEGTLPAGQSARLVAYLPAWPVEPNDYASLGHASQWSAQTDRYWQDMLAKAAQIDIPDRLLANVIRASQVHCLLAARNRQQGKYVVPWAASIWYGSAVESEAQSVLRGMDMLGHTDIVRRGMEHFLKGYNSQGFLTNGFTTVGTGWNLWTVAEHVQRTGDRRWLKTWAADLVRACQWIARQRAKTKRPDADGNKVPEYGLMPPGVAADWGRYSYKFFSDTQYCHGLETIAAELAAISHPKAPGLVAEAKEYRADLLRAYRWTQARCPVVRLQDGTWTSNHPGLLDVFGNVEEMFPVEDIVRTPWYSVELGSHHLAANGILDPASGEVARMMDYLEDYQFLRSGWYAYPEEQNRIDPFNFGGFAKGQPYFCRNAEIYALRDDVKPFIRSYFNAVSSLLSEENLSLWEHFNNTSAWNKTHETGWFLCQTATMFALDRDGDLWLAPMVTNNWLADGKRVSVSNLPTRFGPVSYSTVSAAANGHIRAEIDPPTREPFRRLVLRVRHPEGKPIRAVTVNGKSHLAFDSRTECVVIAPTKDHIVVRVEY